MKFSVCRVSRKFGLKPVGDDEDWTVFWTDTSVLLERVMDMKRYQVSWLFNANLTVVQLQKMFALCINVAGTTLLSSLGTLQAKSKK